MKKHFFRMTLIILLFPLALASIAQPSPAGDSSGNSNPKPEKSVTKHSIKIDNKAINYTATAGTLVLKNDKEEPIAIFGYTAYTKDGETDFTTRPVTFVYNGGPGSSSLWLHLGIIGPRRIHVNDPGPNGPAPYRLEDNNYSLLDVSDLVLIDPVGTGLSRPAGKAKGADFWGVDEDIRSISDFIDRYVTENERWNSPKYLLGESYGTFRSAGIADYLQETYGMSVNGVVLISSVLDIRSLAFQPGDDLSYIVYLPTYAATAWYHNKLANKPADLYAFLKEVREFASGDYAAALMKGDRLSANERDNIIAKLSSYTGLSREYLSKAKMRVNEPQFAEELLRDSTMTIGRLDSRYKGISQDPLSEFAFEDPQSSDISPAFISAFMNYYTTELKVSKDKTYNISVNSPDFRWNWKHPRAYGFFGDASSPYTGSDLVNAMSHNPRMKILVLNGMLDLATPFYGTEYTFDHLNLDAKLKKNISMKYYEAGHMMYVHDQSAAAFKKDVAEFISNSGK